MTDAYVIEKLGRRVVVAGVAVFDRRRSNDSAVQTRRARARRGRPDIASRIRIQADRSWHLSE